MSNVAREPRARRSRPSRYLKVCEYIFLLIALLCLGYVASEYSGATIFQLYQSWRFARAIEEQPTTRVSRADSSLPGPADREPAAPIRPLSPGTLIGRVEIPRIGISVMVMEGTGDGVLRKAAGHVPTSELPGGNGNVVIAGHRDTFFRALRNIRKDDEIIFTTTRGVYRYEVGAMEKVGPRDVQVLRPSDHSTLTLITCYPFNFIGPAPERFVVQAGEILSPPASGPNPSAAPVSPAPAPNLLGGPPSATSRRAVRRHYSLRPPDLPRDDAARAEKSPVRNDSRSDADSNLAAEVEPPAAPVSPPQKIFGRIRSWLGAIPARLHENSSRSD